MNELRRLAWLVAAAALVPLLLFLILQSGFSAREQRRSVEQRALAAASTMIASADGEVKRHFAALDAIATVRSLRDGNMAEFRSRGAELIALNRDWTELILSDARTGKLLAMVGTDGIALDLDRLPPPSESPRFAGFARGAGCPCMIAERSAKGPAGAPLIVRLLVNTRGFAAAMPPAKGNYEVSALVTTDGRFIARSLGGKALFATHGTKYLQGAAASRASSGIYRGITLEGFENYTAFVRSPLTGWSAHLALGSEHIDDPARRFLASMGFAAMLSLALAAVLTWFALRQVTEGRRIAERVQQAQKLEALGQLTGGIAHDFNNLMTPVIGALDFVSKREGIDDSARRMLTRALASAERAGKLTAQLLAFSRRQKLLIEPIDVAAMLVDVADLVRQSVGDAYRVEIGAVEPSVCAFGDLNQLELAILNLTINARDASRPGSLIQVIVTASGSPDDGEVALAVIDEGEGMDEETRRRAVEPFFTTKAVGQGTGLGLAQVFGFAAQAGGRLDIASEPGIGTTVTLFLRRCDGVARSRRMPIDVTAAASTESLRLLVVDDDPLVRAVIVRPLEEAGHNVDAVSDGQTALAAISQRRFDLVITDYAMPGMDGAELIRRAREVRPDSRFLIVTGHADSESVLGAAGETPILKKPFDAAQLVSLVAALSA
jgi:signal transduction histidine kinase/CheY-like chemotaxis protein